jgi:hypothetical protein
MRGFISGLLILLLTVTAAGCAGSSPAPTTGASGASIEIARAAARIGLSVALQAKGVSAEDTATILAELHAIVDGLLAGKDVRMIVTDPALWQPLRADLVSRFAVVISQGKVGGVQVVDQVTAEQLAGSLLDAFASALRR